MSYKEFHRRSIEELEAFWGELAAMIDWHRPFGRVPDYSNPPFAKWFVGGETNLRYNAIAEGHDPGDLTSLDDEQIARAVTVAESRPR